ncbi:substrate-binding domain-containing protein [Trichlorobacter ammonificans]|uniref:ABC transporter, periplasmic substrate-binding protein n=1 Tax=Trichlorobacter ammonificans TaxID=2916410 RepID=A0ABN8HJY7_9BACT|nr:substrate-binding domain-containing protein [Trichlorobacter ammonificans]CAH2031645.1 ABC transporter, periplasmic substrate-binding protein [Trichlorobacter ammonificans]
MKRLFLAFALLAGIITASAAPAEEIVLSTGSGPLDSVITPVKQAFEQESGIRLNILFGSASLAFKQFYKGVSEIAVVGTSFEEALELMKKEQFEVQQPETLYHVVLGKGMVRTVVNKSNPVSRLSRAQLKGIFTGSIVNWNEVGGPDMPIIVVLSTLNPATNGAFRKTILDGEPFMREVLELGHMDELRGAVEVNREAIAIGTSALLGGSAKQVETPEVFRPVTLISRGAPSPKVQKFIDFILQGPGAALVKN